MYEASETIRPFFYSSHVGICLQPDEVTHAWADYLVRQDGTTAALEGEEHHSRAQLIKFKLNEGVVFCIRGLVSNQIQLFLSRGLPEGDASGWPMETSFGKNQPCLLSFGKAAERRFQGNSLPMISW